MAAPVDQEHSRLVNCSLALGLGILLGWKLRNWTSSARVNLPRWSDWITPRYKLVLVVRGDLPAWSRARMAVHCSSASILACRNSSRQSPISLLFWRITGQAKVVVSTPTGFEFIGLCEEASKRQVCTSLIKETVPPDAKQNRFEAENKSMVLAVGPGPSSLLDQITGHLKLY